MCFVVFSVQMFHIFVNLYPSISYFWCHCNLHCLCILISDCFLIICQNNWFWYMNLVSGKICTPFFNLWRIFVWFKVLHSYHYLWSKSILLPFQPPCFLFLSIALLYWLNTSTHCRKEVVRMDILDLFLIFERKHSVFHYYVWGSLQIFLYTSIVGLQKFSSVPISWVFHYIKMLNFVKCFSALYLP